MNHLAHFRLAMGEPHLIVGAFLGDQVKGRLNGRLAPDLEQGIQLHREIDAFTDAHPVAKRSYARFEPKLRRYCPILIDLFYDHLLATNWRDYHHQSLQEFSATVFTALRANQDRLPAGAMALARGMERSDILRRYAQRETIAGVLRHVSSRLSRPNPVGQAFEPFLDNLAGLESDFHEFFPLLEAFALERIRDRDETALAQLASAHPNHYQDVKTR